MAIESSFINLLRFIYVSPCLSSLVFRIDSNSAEAQNRTGDTRIFSAVLYQLSYLGMQSKLYLEADRVSSVFRV